MRTVSARQRRVSDRRCHGGLPDVAPHRVYSFAGSTGPAGLTSLTSAPFAVPGLSYPRPAASFPPDMPAPQATMPDPGAGVPVNPWCPAGG